MDGVRDELLADAALAGDQHLRVGPGDALDLLRQLANRGAGADQLSVTLASHTYLCSSLALVGSGSSFMVRVQVRIRSGVRQPTRRYSLAFRRNSSRLRRLFSSMPTNTAPSAGFDSRLWRSTIALHLHIRRERRRADAGLHVGPGADRQLRLAREQRARQADVDQPHPRPHLQPALEPVVDGHPRHAAAAPLPVIIARSPSRSRLRRHFGRSPSAIHRSICPTSAGCTDRNSTPIRYVRSPSIEIDGFTCRTRTCVDASWPS